MASLKDKLLVGKGLAQFSMTIGLLTLDSLISNVNPDVWILSTTTKPQPANKVGLWYDGYTWVDTNVWYD